MDAARDSSDERLLVEARRSAEAFAELYRRYEGAMLGYFVRRVRSPDLAADLAAETFAQALASCRKYRVRKGPAAAWLFGIARHVLARSLERGRVEDRARRRACLPALSLTDEALEAVLAYGSGLDAEVEALLARLPSPQREAVRARVIDERGYAEIATELRCSESVVRKRVSRGLAALRTEMESTR
jgi:RNA polymerase sigma-70 factor (ECF subfamily)